ncbi:hypothetical protein [Pseudophaeobacter sp. EL27]|uniref:hypothetical protein n=1 Tax=Pseudophaeobacter sp. EL27 TaxID=2107580 RepID=UPI0013C4CE9B|nr:hypothetical protein [Pseudophaeobacter sp. EL27]
MNFDPDRHKKSRWRNFEFFDGSVLGMLVGVVFALLLVWALDSDLTQEIENKIFDIVAFLVAIFAAFVALGGVLMQLRAQSDLEEKRRKDELEGEAAALSFTLVHVMKMSQKGIQELVGKDFLDLNLWVSVEMEVSETQLSSIKSAIRLTHGKERHG